MPAFEVWLTLSNFSRSLPISDIFFRLRSGESGAIWLYDKWDKWRRHKRSHRIIRAVDARTLILRASASRWRAREVG